LKLILTCYYVAWWRFINQTLSFEYWHRCCLECA